MKVFKISILLIVLFSFPFVSHAIKLDSLKYTQHREFFLDWDNDMFLYRDFYYTQGSHLSYLAPGLRKNPANHILFRLNNADYYYGIGLIQEIYTPKDIADTLLNTVDRPYSGTLYFRSFTVSSIPDKRIRFTNQLDLGILGPLSGAKQAQQIIHDWLDLGFPNGWDFQIENRPYINYNAILEKGLFDIPGIFEFNANSRLRLGNIHDDLLVGATIRLGRINDYFKGYNLSNKTYEENKDFQAFIFAGASAVAVAYNATLMGGIIPPPDNNIGFELKDINNLVGELTGGFQLSYKYIGVKFHAIWKTPEFKGGENHGWGTISVYARF